MSDYSELWEVVDELDDIRGYHANEDIRICYGISVAKEIFIKALTRLGIERPQPVRDCKGCKWCGVQKDGVGFCKPRPLPVWVVPQWVALASPMAEDCPCFEPKED